MGRLTRAGFQPHVVRDVDLCLIAERPHVVQKSLRKPDLNSLRLNPIIQDRQQVRNRLIRPVRSRRKSEGLLGVCLLSSLLDKVPHVPFEEPNQVTAQFHVLPMVNDGRVYRVYCVCASFASLASLRLLRKARHVTDATDALSAIAFPRASPKRASVDPCAGTPLR